MDLGRGRNLTQNIMSDLGQSIVMGEYDNNKAFPTEAELCEQFNVSRSIIREAVKMLTSKGMLSSRPRQGTKVRSEENWNILDEEVLEWFLKKTVSLSLLREFTEIRLAVEPAAAEIAAQKQNIDDIEKIGTALERMQSAENGLDDPLEADIEFHLALLDASGNRFFKQLKNLSETALRSSIKYTNRQKGVRHADVKAHEKVYFAIKNKMPELAKQEATMLISEVMALLDK
ncbi:MAG: FadR/GntR family transcriptional regulator [Emcibacteraceae bacterium]|jgi:DNA-binding FadR family transcriptional regulator|uniref:FadR/GntR family transcriptional regulator n=1 Tax=Pseudemcibacter sp. TaxID=2943293 RepID=UPI00231E6AD9|nr:FadR family transcriptional regulator [Emcibacteraceae bacterium]MDG1021683.1 FadR/GntR family transcriptional regulator [Emcibacteraceae bacterium]MDG1726024.1 FadR/GntR family transcriptional regulator [Emcibacteraceae bacterium]